MSAVETGLARRPAQLTEAEIATRMKNDAFAVGYLKAHLRQIVRSLQGTRRVMKDESLAPVRALIDIEIEEAERTLRLAEGGK